MLETDLLKTFLAISQTGSFTAAAREVGRTQSAVSMQVRRLEKILGRPLLRRSSHGVELTAHGHLLLGHAQAILEAQAAAVAAFGRGDAFEGPVVVGIPDDYAPRLLPVLLDCFRRLETGARLEIVCEQSATLLRLLAEGAVDLAFITDAVAGGGRGPVVHREPTVWVGAGETHRLEPLPLAVFQEVDLYRKWMLDALERQGRRYRIVATSKSMTGVQAAVGAGIGVSAIAHSSVTPTMRILSLDEGFPPLPVLEVRLERGRGRGAPVAARLEAAMVERCTTP